ncbi:hypothetical protein L0F63_000424, partial [Massospora cicadina]
HRDRQQGCLDFKLPSSFVIDFAPKSGCTGDTIFPAIRRPSHSNYQVKGYVFKRRNQ